MVEPVKYNAFEPFSSWFNPFMTEAVIICSTNQWTGFYMITASIMKELKENAKQEFGSFSIFT